MKGFRALRRWLDTFESSPGLRMPGHWRVFYKGDQKWSTRMTYDMATDYAEMFNGEVHWVRYNDPVKNGQGAKP